MKRILTIIYILCCVLPQATAQRVTRNYQRRPMPEVLIDLSKATERYHISFIYNELEDYTVTVSIKNATLSDAIRQVIGFYPIKATIGDSLITVECVQKDRQKLIGHLVDNEGQPLPYANVQLLNPVDSSLITGGVTNENGDFVIPCSEKKIIARFSYLGFKTTDITTTPRKLGTVRLQPEATSLQGVTVKGYRPHYKLTNEGMQTQVEGTVLAKAGNMEQLLNLIPFVSSRNGKVTVMGRGTPLIYINGRRMRDPNELQRMQSEDIKSVEVIKLPGARYEASATSVIKIVTKRKPGDGFGVDSQSTVQVNEQNRMGAWETLNLTYNRRKLNVSASLTGAYTHQQDDKYTELDTYLKDQWKQTMDINQEYTNVTASARLGANYQLDDHNAVGASVRYYRAARKEGEGTTESAVFQNDALTEQSFDYYFSPEQSKTVYTNAYYNGKVGKLGIDFNTDYYWMGDKEQNTNWETISAVGQEPTQVDVTTDKHNYDYQWASKLNFTLPLLGGQLIFGGEYSTTKTKTRYEAVPQGIIDDEHNRIRESLTSAMIDYNRAIGPVNIDAGLRYEYADFNFYDRGVYVPEQSRTYGKWFPSLSLVWPVGKTQMQLAYTSDISRPSYWNLRSGVNYANHYTFESGNPFLVPSISRNLSYAFAWSWLSLQALYMHTSDEINFLSQPYNGDPTKTLVRPENMKGYDAVALMSSISPTIGIWTPTLSMTLMKNWYKMDTPFGPIRNNPIAQFQLTNTIDAPWLTIMVSSELTTEGNTSNNYMSRTYFNTDVSLIKRLLKNRLELRLYASDIFHTADRHATVFSGPQRLMRVVNYSSSSIFFTLRYRFNVAPNKYKGTGAGKSQRDRM